MHLGPDFTRIQTAAEAAATWAVASNWQDQRATIAAVHRRFGAMLGRTLDAALAKHADPGPGYGHIPAEFGAERQVRALPKVQPTAAELDRERQERERFEAVRDRVARRFGLLEPLTTYRKVTPEEMAEIRLELELPL
jgi:hypothetical protein